MDKQVVFPDPQSVNNRFIESTATATDCQLMHENARDFRRAEVAQNMLCCRAYACRITDDVVPRISYHWLRNIRHGCRRGTHRCWHIHVLHS